MTDDKKPTKNHKPGVTFTSSFGTRGKFSHDASLFYSTRLFEGLPQESKVSYQENLIERTKLNQIFQKTAEHMEELPEKSIHLMVTSPPYNASKEYDQDLSLEEYADFLRRVWQEVERVLVPGGRACINIANLGRKPYIALHALIIKQMLELGFLMRGEIIWNKAASAAGSTAWGSWRSATNPTLRDIHEYILIFSKNTFRRQNPQKREATISKEQFLEYSKSIWSIATESARRIGHPAPYPIELPYRLIQLYTFRGEVVLDPFMGSGQTALAAIKSERYYVGYEINPEYVELALSRIKKVIGS